MMSPFDIFPLVPMTPEEVLDFWFTHQTQWFVKDPDFDHEIYDRFFETYELAAHGKLESWQKQAESMLALIIVLDQFPRNMFRDTPNMFRTDARALALAKIAVSLEFDQALPSDQHRQMMYMPYMHSENLADQDLCIELLAKTGCEEALRFAHMHRDVIERFGRFPHRNIVLERESTPEEEQHLRAQGGF